MDTFLKCCLILLTYFVEVHSEPKIVYRGEKVLLFANVTADSPDQEYHLYINGVKNSTLIATWKFENERFTMVPKSNFSVFMDAAGNIWIPTVDETYNGKYILYNSSRPGIEITLGSSPNNSENTSQNPALWIVYVALTIVGFAFVLYVAHTKQWKKKIPSCHKCRRGKHLTKQEKEQSEGLVNEPNPQNKDIDMTSQCSQDRMDIVADESKKPTVVESSVKSNIVQVETIERAERVTVSDQKPQNDDMSMSSNGSKDRTDKVFNERKKPTVVESSSKLAMIQEEKAEREEKRIVNYEKPGYEEDDMNYFLCNERLNKLKAEMKADKAKQETSIRQLKAEMKLEQTKRKIIETETKETSYRLERIEAILGKYMLLIEKREGSTESFTSGLDSSLFDRHKTANISRSSSRQRLTST